MPVLITVSFPHSLDSALFKTGFKSEFTNRIRPSAGTSFASIDFTASSISLIMVSFVSAAVAVLERIPLVDAYFAKR